MQDITPLQFWSGILIVTLPQIIQLISKWRDAKIQKPLTDAQGESAMGDALEKLGQAYDRTIKTIKSQDDELVGLRPLVLDISLAKQNLSQCQLDKDDWKSHAQKLEEQLIAHNFTPVVFKRHSMEDSEKMRAITKTQIDKYLHKKKKGNGGEE